MSLDSVVHSAKPKRHGEAWLGPASEWDISQLIAKGLKLDLGVFGGGVSQN